MGKSVQVAFVFAAIASGALFSVGCSSSSPATQAATDSGVAESGAAKDASTSGNDASGSTLQDASADATSAAVCFDAAASVAEIPTCFATTCATQISACTSNCACETAFATAVTDYFVDNNPSGAATVLAGGGTAGQAVLACLGTASTTCVDAGPTDGAVVDAAGTCFDASAMLPSIPGCISGPCGSQVSACVSNCACENALESALGELKSNPTGAASALSASGSAGSALATCISGQILSCLADAN